jgi:hypothetical protein
MPRENVVLPCGFLRVSIMIHTAAGGKFLLRHFLCKGGEKHDAKFTICYSNH